MIRYIFIFANLGIFLAYISIAFRRAIHIRSILAQTRWWGVVFFVTCGFTHLFMAGMTQFHVHWHDTLPWWFVLNHIVQFFAAWFFLQTTAAEKAFIGAKNMSIDIGPPPSG